jgi:site-specific DNA recombinase
MTKYLIDRVMKREESNLMKCAVYTRVSTEDQNTSIVNQHEYFTNYINRNEWELHDIYTDENFSGTESKKRLSFQRMVKDAKLNKYNILLAKSYSRFGRNQRETLNTIAELHALNIRIIFIEDNLDSKRDLGQFGLFAWLAEQEARKVSDRIKLIWNHYDQQGKIHAPHPSYGYDYSKEIKNFVVNKEEAKVVRKIFSLYIQGYGLDKIARTLQEEGVRTKKGGKWANTTIRTIITNQVYIGNLVQGKSETMDVTIKKRKKKDEKEWMIHVDHHKAIISKETFLKVQSLLQERSLKAKNNLLGATRHSNKSLFSNIIKCKECNSTLTIKRQKHFKNYSPYYTCISYELQGAKRVGHKRNAIYQETLITYLKDELYDLQTENYKKIKEIFKAKREEEKPKSVKNELKVIEKKIDEQTRLSMSLLNAYSNGILGQTQFKLQNEIIEKNLKTLIQQREELINRSNNMEVEVNEENELKKNIEKLLNLDEEKWTNAMLKEIIEVIYVDIHKNVEITFKYQNSKDANLGFNRFCRYL